MCVIRSIFDTKIKILLCTNITHKIVVPYVNSLALSPGSPFEQNTSFYVLILAMQDKYGCFMGDASG